MNISLIINLELNIKDFIYLSRDQMRTSKRITSDSIIKMIKLDILEKHLVNPTPRSKVK